MTLTQIKSLKFENLPNLNASAHIFHQGFEISAQVSLWIILGILSIGVLASLFKTK